MNTTPHVPLALIKPKARPAWTALQTALAHTDPPCSARGNRELFFDDERVDAAVKLCGYCPVRRLCLDYATAAQETGVWGGRQLPLKGRAATLTPPPGSAPSGGVVRAVTGHERTFPRSYAHAGATPSRPGEG